MKLPRTIGCDVVVEDDVKVVAVGAIVEAVVTLY